MSLLIGDATSVFWYLYGIATRDTAELLERVETTTGLREDGGSDIDAVGKSDSIGYPGTDDHRTKNVAWIYDFFMGTCLYPRIGEIGASSTTFTISLLCLYPYRILGCMLVCCHLCVV